MISDLFLRPLSALPSEACVSDCYRQIVADGIVRLLSRVSGAEQTSFQHLLTIQQKKLLSKQFPEDFLKLQFPPRPDVQCRRARFHRGRPLQKLCQMRIILQINTSRVDHAMI